MFIKPLFYLKAVTLAFIITVPSLHSNNVYAKVTNKYWVAGHSLFTYVGGDSAPNTDYTNTGNWLGLIASKNKVEASGSYTFGQTPDFNAYNWSNLSNIPLTGTFYRGNTTPFDPRENGLQKKKLDRYIFMPSNFLATDVGAAPFKGGEKTYQKDAEAFIANASKHWANAEPILYVHVPDAGQYGSYPLSQKKFDRFIKDTTGDYLDWHIRVQDSIRESGYKNLRTCPAFPTWLDIVKNESFLANTSFDDYFGDSAPHGTETAYFLSALVLYRCIYQENPDMSGFKYPSGTTIIDEVKNNLPLIINAIDERLNQFNMNGVKVY